MQAVFIFCCIYDFSIIATGIYFEGRGGEGERERENIGNSLGRLGYTLFTYKAVISKLQIKFLGDLKIVQYGQIGYENTRRIKQFNKIYLFFWP